MEISHFMQVFCAGRRSSSVHMSQKMTCGGSAILSDMFRNVQLLLLKFLDQKILDFFL